MPNDDPKWDELEQHLRKMALLWYSATPKDDTKYEWPESDYVTELKDLRNKYDELKLNLGPQVEADEWPSVIGDE